MSHIAEAVHVQGVWGVVYTQDLILVVYIHFNIHRVKTLSTALPSGHGAFVLD